MKWDLFKNRLKKDAQQDTDAVDIDALWSAIEPDVDALNNSEKKRKRFFFWFFFGTALVLAGGWLVWSNGSLEQEGTLAEKEKLSKASVVLSEDEKSPNKIIIKNNETKTKTELLTVISNDFQKKESLISVDKADAKSDFKNEEAIKDFQETINDDRNIRNQNTNKSSNKSALKLEALIAEESKFQQELNKHGQTIMPLPGKSLSISEMPPSKDSASSTRSSQRPEAEGSDRQKESKKTQSTLLTIATINQLDLNSLSIKMENGLLPFKEEAISDVFVYPYSQKYLDLDEDSERRRKSKSNIALTAGITAGLSFANRNLSQKEGSESLLFQNRNKYESSLETSHYGFFVGAQHEKYNFGITIGLQNTTIAERYSYKNEEVTMEMITGVEVRRINLEGDTIDVMGLIPETTTTTIDKNIYNSYRLLDVPVILSYQFPTEKWNIGIEAGVLANLSLKTEGIVPNALLEDQSIDNSQNDLFKTKVGLGYHFGLSFGRNITEKIQWSLSPVLRIYPNDFAGSTNDLSQRYVLYGLNGGVAYRF